MINRVLSFLVPLLFFIFSLQGQSTDQIAFIAFNADGSDDFAFVALGTLSANTTIYFTDNEILNDSSLSTGEGILSWYNNSVTAAGTVVIVNNASSSSSITANIGVISAVSGNFNLSASGDGLIAYQGPNENQVSHWLSAVENSNNKVGNINSTNLIQNQSYIQFNKTSSPDGGIYTGVRSGEASLGAYKVLIKDAINWQEDVSNGLSILPISSLPFSSSVSSSAQLLLESGNLIIDSISQQGDTAHLIGNFSLEALHGTTSLVDLNFTFSGNYDSNDFVSFQLKSSSGNLASGPLLSQISADSLKNDSLSFRNLNIAFNSGDSLMLHLLAKIDSSANPNHNFQLNTVDAIISQGQLVDSSQNFAVHQIEALQAEIVLSPVNTLVSNDSIAQDSSNHPCYAFQMESRFKEVNLISLSANLQGNLATSDIVFFKLWHSNDSVYQPSEDQLIGATNFIDSNGLIEFSGLNFSLPKNKLETFFISIDLSCTAQEGNSFRIAGLDSSHLKFTQQITFNGHIGISPSTFIVKSDLPLVENLSYQAQGTELSISWTNPNCIDEALVFIHDKAFNDSLSGVFNVNSNSYLDSLNDTLITGATAVYKGLASTSSVKNLQAGQNYYCSLFTRRGTRYSKAQSFSFFLANDPALIISQYYEGQSNDKWLEITNVGDTAIDLSDFYIARWSNTSIPSGSASSSNQLSGILSSGSSTLMQHSSAAKPFYASGVSGGSLAFNGNDAMAICRNSAEWDKRIDCIYTNGYWGENTSFYRKAWVLNPNRAESILDGSGEWQEATIGLVDSSIIGQTARLGEHAFGLASGDFTFNGSVWLPQDPQGISTSQNSVVIQSGKVSLSSNLACSFLQVLNQASLNLSNGALITIEDSLINDGIINISGNASILQNDTGLINPNSGSGIFTIKSVYQATAVDRFKFWSSPLSDAVIENCFTNTNPTDRYYFHSGGQNPGYKSYPTGTMQAGRAYALTPNLPASLSQVNFTDSVVFEGDSLNNGDIIIGMDSLSAGDYVFLGNPYPSPIDFNLFLNENSDLNASLWYWDASPNDKSNSAFAVWNNQGAVSVGNTKKGSPSNIVPAMQGFIVRIGQSISPNSHYSFTFKNSMRVGIGAASSPFFKSSTSASKIKLCLRSSRAESYCLISSDARASAQFEEAFDAPIYKANQHQSFYSLAGDKFLSIQALDIKPNEEQIVPLGIDAWHAGSYSVILDSSSILDSSLSVFLVDSLNSFERDLRSQAYSFQISDLGIDTNRFYLKIGKNAKSSLSRGLNPSLGFDIWQNSRGQIEVRLLSSRLSYENVQLYSLNSQLLENWTLSTGQNHFSLDLSQKRSGLFLLNLRSKAGTNQSVKIYLQP